MNAERSVAVPFIMVGNRRALSFKQLYEDTCLMGFVARFKHCFESGLPDGLCVWFFIEPGNDLDNLDPHWGELLERTRAAAPPIEPLPASGPFTPDAERDVAAVRARIDAVMSGDS